MPGPDEIKDTVESVAGDNRNLRGKLINVLGVYQGQLDSVDKLTDMNRIMAIVRTHLRAVGRNYSLSDADNQKIDDLVVGFYDERLSHLIVQDTLHRVPKMRSLSELRTLIATMQMRLREQMERHSRKTDEAMDVVIEMIMNRAEEQGIITKDSQGYWIDVLPKR